MKISCVLLLILFSFFTNAKTIEKIIAIVNEEIITLSDLTNYQSKIKKGGLVDDALLKLSDTKKLMSSKEALIEHMIDEKILDSEVKRKGLSVTIEKVEQEVRNISKRNGISRDQLKSALKAKKVNFSDYQDFIKTSLERQSLIEKEVSSKIKISTDDISAYYVANSTSKDGMVFEFTLSHIMFLKSKGGTLKAKGRAEKFSAKVRKKQKFGKLASKFSEDPNFSKDGLLGTFKAGEMLKEFEAAITNLGEGDISNLVETKSGFHYIKVLKKKLVADPKLEAEKQRIRGILFAETFKRQFRQWLDTKRLDAFIRIN